MKRFMLASLNFCRYKRLLCSVDLSKDFFFSYSYNIMHSLQKNITEKNTGQVVYETMCVWNEFLTRAIRNHLKNTCWTIALVHGFFKQVYSSAVSQQLSWSSFASVLIDPSSKILITSLSLSPVPSIHHWRPQVGVLLTQWYPTNLRVLLHVSWHDI